MIVAHTPAKSEVIHIGHGLRPHGANITTTPRSAIPFAISREEAIDRLSWNTAAYTGNKFVGTLLRRFFPSLDVDALRPTRLQATYLPTWVVDAEVLATAWLKKQESDSEFLKVSGLCAFVCTTLCNAVHAGLHSSPIHSYVRRDPLTIDSVISCSLWYYG